MPNIGIDTNVFNDPAERDAEERLYRDGAPKTDLWLRTGADVAPRDGGGRHRLVSDLLHRAFGRISTYQLGWKAPLNRLVAGGPAPHWLHTKPAPDSKSTSELERKVADVRQQASRSAGSRERSSASAAHGRRCDSMKTPCSRAPACRSSWIGRSLRRRSRVRHAITPLTSIIFSAGRAEERFRSPPSRDSTSDDYSVELSFDPAAL